MSGGSVVTHTTEAIYERGVLRPISQQLPLKEGQRVRVAVELIPDQAQGDLTSPEASFINQMKAERRVLTIAPPPEPPPSNWKPLLILGEPLSETIIKMRGEQG
jgi:predicted DNA-binding antitoxin AbrB/MazE fold protein